MGHTLLQRWGGTQEDVGLYEYLTANLNVHLKLKGLKTFILGQIQSDFRLKWWTWTFREALAGRRPFGPLTDFPGFFRPLCRESAPSSSGRFPASQTKTQSF